MKVKELLTSHHRWCKRSIALDNKGRGVHETDHTACRWCIAGAVLKCYLGDNGRMEILGKIRKYLKNDDIGDWNDDPKTTFEDIKKLVEKLDI